MVNFVEDIKKELEEKKKVSEKTIIAYVKAIQRLNNNQELKNLDFLKKNDDIKKITDTYKPNTQRNFYIAIVSVLSLFPKYRKLYDQYYEILKDLNKTLKEEEGKNEKSETQEKNWMEWDDIMKKWEELKIDIDTFKDKKGLKYNEYTKLLNFVVLSLYTLQPPRRNSDYHMFIVKNDKDNDESKNLLDLDHDEFVFNNFKTKKTEGTITLPINEELKNVIDIYLKHHPLIDKKLLKQKKGVINNVPFLVFSDGKPINPANGITYILNKILDKHIGPSMMRHIYLSNKYGDIKKEQEEDSKAMSHSTGMQSLYVKH